MSRLIQTGAGWGQYPSYDHEWLRLVSAYRPVTDPGNLARGQRVFGRKMSGMSIRGSHKLRRSITWVPIVRLMIYSGLALGGSPYFGNLP